MRNSASVRIADLLRAKMASIRKSDVWEFPMSTNLLVARAQLQVARYPVCLRPTPLQVPEIIGSRGSGLGREGLGLGDRPAGPWQCMLADCPV